MSRVCSCFFAVNLELQVASIQGDISKIASCLDRGAQVNVRIDAFSPLDLAALNGHSSCVELLVARGADIDATDEEDRTALYKSVHLGHDAVTLLLLEKGAAIDMAAEDHGFTPLILAASQGKTSTVRLLLQRGADKEKKCNIEGVNALEWAQNSPFNTEEIERMLRD